MLIRSSIAVINCAAAFVLLGAVYGQSERGGPAFDVASVKLLPPPISGRVMTGGGPGTSDPGRLTRSNVTLGSILTEAFRTQGNLVVGQFEIDPLPEISSRDSPTGCSPNAMKLSP
jgi:hypothetical protein